MVLNDIEKLIEKYENGETSLKEEQQLKHYFSQETVAPHLEMYKHMFAYFLLNKQEQFTKDVPLNPNKRFLNYKWISVAAVAVLMLGFYFNNSSEDLGTYNEDQAELAYNDVVQSLKMISTHFNKGATTVGYLKEMNKGRSTIEYLDEIEEAKRIIFKTNN